MVLTANLVLLFFPQGYRYRPPRKYNHTKVLISSSANKFERKWDHFNAMMAIIRLMIINRGQPLLRLAFSTSNLERVGKQPQSMPLVGNAGEYLSLGPTEYYDKLLI